MAGKTLLGKLDSSAFGILELPRLPGALHGDVEPGGGVAGDERVQ
jgi:hypothetical protein